MSKIYPARSTVTRYSIYSLLLPSFLLLLCQPLRAQVKDSTVTGIYTDYKTYWSTSAGANSTVNPDTSHNLLAFVFRGKTYSTGVNNAILNTKLGSLNYSAQVYKALPIKSIDGNVVNGNATYIATAIKNDGDSTKAAYTIPYPNIRIADVLTDGKNGLDLGTGVTNISAGARISFTIKTLSTKSALDTVPDLLFTQIADPTANKADTIYFYDTNGKLVGNKKLVFWNAVSKLGTYKLDLYTLSQESCNTSSINGTYQSNTTRDIRMVAFLLTEFGITNADSAAKVKGIQISPNGTSDQAFIAYNTNIINIDVPAITTQPASQVFCDTSTRSVTFSVSATSTTSMTYQWKKNGAAIPGATSASYTANSLLLSDTANAYSVTISNTVGSVTSNNAYIRYVIVTPPTGINSLVGNTITFTTRTSGATAFQWYKNAVPILGATSSSYMKTNVTLLDMGSYSVSVTHSAGTCVSTAATLAVGNLAIMTLQPKTQVLCTTASSPTVTFNSAATTTLIFPTSYQWFKNGVAISGATDSNFTTPQLTLADTANKYYVTASNLLGPTYSDTIGVKFVINSQPAANLYLPTGNPAVFSTTVSSAATGLQWRRDGTNVSGATSSSYQIDTVTMAAAGKYTLRISYSGGFCVTDTAVLRPTTMLYSKAAGDLADINTWGVNTDGSGAIPLTFGRPEHTFTIANRSLGTNGSNVTITGTYDLANSVTTIAPGTTMEAGRIIRSQAGGVLSGNATANLIVHGKSDLYFDAASKVLKNLTINTTDTVTLRSALNITGGKGRGIVRITSGVFNTGDSLTLKSDSLGTASVGNSPGTIKGKVTIEQYIPAHRAWRLFASPVSDSLAPTIHDAWQEGAVSSTDDPHPGYGTHITYGAVSDGFDQNPQKTFSMKVRNAGGQWTGVPATNTTKVTDYPAYFFFIRGNRSYDIEHTDYNMTPKPTIIRTTGYLRQHTQPNVPVNDSGYTMVANPYASPVDFESMYRHSSLSHYLWMWNPSLAGNKGAGAYVLVYWNGSSYSTTPALSNANDMRFLQSYQGFLVKSNGSFSSANFGESDKDTSSLVSPFGREVEANTPKLEVNLNVYNDDSSTAVADGVTYLFSNSFNSSIDGDDITKLGNINENFGIRSNGKLLALEQRAMPAATDSLQLSLVNAKATSYLINIIPDKMDSFSLYLYDRYLGTKTALKASDTSHVKIAIDQSAEASKAADRFVIISKVVAPPVVMFAHISATLQEAAIRVDWNAINEAGVVSYRVQRSADGSNFTEIGSVAPSGKQSYSFTDNKPLKGINYYRVLSINRNGSPSVSGVVSEAFNRSERSYAAVYPNPLTSNHCVLELHNKPAGKYDLTMTNSAGAVVYTASVTITGAGNKQALVLPASLAKGTYHLKIESSFGKETIKVVSLY